MLTQPYPCFTLGMQPRAPSDDCGDCKRYALLGSDDRGRRNTSSVTVLFRVSRLSDVESYATRRQVSSPRSGANKVMPSAWSTPRPYCSFGLRFSLPSVTTASPYGSLPPGHR